MDSGVHLVGHGYYLTGSGVPHSIGIYVEFFCAIMQSVPWNWFNVIHKIGFEYVGFDYRYSNYFISFSFQMCNDRKCLFLFVVEASQIPPPQTVLCVHLHKSLNNNFTTTYKHLYKFTHRHTWRGVHAFTLWTPHVMWVSFCKCLCVIAAKITYKSVVFVVYFLTSKECK